VVRRGERLVGVLPLYVGRKGNLPFAPRRLAFVSTGAAEFEETCTEYLNLLHAPDEASACVTALRPALLGNLDCRWDELDLSHMSEDSPLLELSASCAGSFRRVTVTSPGACHLAYLPDGLEAYLRRLSGDTRKEARKVLQEADRAGMRLELASDPVTIQTFFDQLVSLHRERWIAAGKPGSFATRHAEFHGTLARLLVPKGQVVLARLCLGGEPFAVINAHRVRDKLDIYQQGVPRRAGPVRSPGTAATLLLMARLLEEGVTTFDQLHGSNDFKRRYFKEERRLSRLRVMRPTWRLLVGNAADFARRAAGKVWRQVGRK
jgi:hypothetical protein